MKQLWVETQIKRLLTSTEITPSQKDVLKRFDKESDKMGGLTVTSRQNQLFWIFKLAKAVPKDFKDMTKDDLEDFIFSLDMSPSSINQGKIYIKKFFKWIYKSKDYPEIVEWIKLVKRKTKTLPSEILSQTEVKALLDTCDNPRDRAIISVMYESGCRLGEMAGLKQKNVTIDQYGAVLSVTGKTGSRRIRLIDSAPDLTLWLNSHPNKGSDNPVFVSFKDTKGALGETGYQQLFKVLIKRAGFEKHVHPHLLRHSRATHLAKDFTESELKVIFGWVGDSRMPGVYVSLSGGDVEKKMLERAGLIDRDEARKEDDVLKPRNCPRCKEVNPATSRFCNKCGMVLDLKTAVELDNSQKDIDKSLSSLLDSKLEEMIEKRASELINEKLKSLAKEK